MKKIIISIIIFILVVIGFLVCPKFFGAHKSIACTEEAKICPDGSAVGRIGPNCEFAKCPEVVGNDLWKTFIDEKQGIEFKYPEKLLADYVSALEWPPKVTLATGTFSCVETLGASSLPARTLKRTVDNRVYCLEAMSEGAAGSVYTNYTYTTQKDDKVITVKFILRYPQCDNYDDPAKTNCKNERTSFDLDGIINRIVVSITVGN